MITGIKNWEMKCIRYEQTENAIEAIIKKINKENNISVGYLESCGPSAFCTLMEGLGVFNFLIQTPTGASIQGDDFVTCYLNDPRNQFEDGDRMDNRYLRSYPILAQKLFNLRSETLATSFSATKHLLSQGNGVQLCLQDPGHFIAAIAVDEDKNCILYHDSWGTRNKGPKLRNGGLFERLYQKDFSNMIGTMIVYYKRIM